jgi:hypothetical protein
METEKVIIEIPAKALHLEHASCPKGHGLMDPSVPINGYPSIKVVLQYGDVKGIVHLDPVYGSFHNIFDVDIPEGVVVKMFCPICDADMGVQEDRSCDWCFSPMFQMHLPHNGMVEGCLKVGCHRHRLKLVDIDEQLGMIHGHDEIQLLM